eukprot:777596-Pyramimonas_sp.AAC.1
MLLAPPLAASGRHAHASPVSTPGGRVALFRGKTATLTSYIKGLRTVFLFGAFFFAPANHTERDRRILQS